MRNPSWRRTREDLPREPPDRRAGHAAAFERLARARGHERVIGGPTRVLPGLAVSGDRAVDQARVRRKQCGVIDPELRGDCRTEALDHDIRPAREREEHPAIGFVTKVEGRAAFAPRPHARAGELGERIPRGRLDPRDPRAVIGQQHSGHGSRNAPGQVEHLEAAQDP
jgi:hypothetical protein